MKVKPWKAPDEHRDHRHPPPPPPPHAHKPPHEVLYEGLEVVSAQLAELQDSIDALRAGQPVAQ